MRLQPFDLRRRLFITFRGEEGLDYGGVARYLNFTSVILADKLDALKKTGTLTCLNSKTYSLQMDMLWGNFDFRSTIVVLGQL